MIGYHGPARNGVHAGWGLAAGTTVHGENRDILVEDVRPGLKLKSADGSLRDVRAVYRTAYGYDLSNIFPDGVAYVPQRVLGNSKPIYVLPGQHVLLSDPIVEITTGAPEILVTGLDLLGFGGIRPAMPVDGIEAYAFEFDGEAVIRANSGLNLFCPSERRGASPSQRYGVAGPALAHFILRDMLAPTDTQISDPLVSVDA